MSLRTPKLSSPFSSDTEEEKEVLNQRLNLYKDRLDDQWTDLKGDILEYGKRALVIGGVVLGVYGLLKLILPHDSESDEPADFEFEPKKASSGGASENADFTLSGAVQSILWAAAMGWAKEKVKDFVTADKPEEEEVEN